MNLKFDLTIMELITNLNIFSVTFAPQRETIYKYLEWIQLQMIEYHPLNYHQVYGNKLVQDE